MKRPMGDPDSRGRIGCTINDMESRTVQGDAFRADINTILRTFDVGQVAQSLDLADANFMDISEFTDYRDALDHAKSAQADFMKLHPDVRAIFDNDVAVWLDTAHDEDKRQALIKAGFLEDPTPTRSSEPAPSEPNTPAPEPGPGGEAPNDRR